MSAKGAWLRDVVLDYLCGNASPSPDLSTLYVGWLSELRDPTDFTELSHYGYARNSFTNNAAAWTTPHVGARTLAQAFDVDLSGAEADAIGFALFTSASGSDVVYAGHLGRAVRRGVSTRLAPGALCICEYKHGSTLNERILDYVAGNTPLSDNSIGSWHLGVATGSIATGVWSGDTYPGLTRVSFSNSASDWTVATDGSRSYKNQLLFAQAATALGPLVSFGLFESAAAAEPLVRGALNQPLSVSIGGVVGVDGDTLFIDEV
jgi:hypothetical protein